MWSGIRWAVPKKGFQGDAFYTAQNPPYGAVFTAYMKDKIKTRKKNGRRRRKRRRRRIETLPYPTQ